MIFVWPVPGFYRVSSPFGNRVLNGVTEFHRGIDIGRNLSPPQPIENAEIIAIAAGKVTSSFFSTTGGNMIVINHGNGIQSRYLHNSVNLVRIQQEVRQGQLIGRVGNTGHSFGAHLHLDIIINEQHVNPMLHLNPRSTAPLPAAPPLPPATPPQTNQIFRVQVGAFHVRENADAMVTRLRTHGFAPFITKNSNLFRVQVGAFQNRTNADNLRNRLVELGFDAFVFA